MIPPTQACAPARVRNRVRRMPIDGFLSREQAEDALAARLRDEPQWRYLLRIEEIELASESSPN
jgi:hypothetical protein